MFRLGHLLLLSIVLASRLSNMADIWEKGKRLFDLCDSDENDIDRISLLLDDLSEDERIVVVNYRNEVSES